MDSSYEPMSQKQPQSQIYEPSRSRLHERQPDSPRGYDSTYGQSASSHFECDAVGPASSRQHPWEEHSHGIRGAIWEILMLASIIVLTMSVLSGVLLWAIYKHRLDSTRNTIGGLSTTDPFSGFNMSGFLHPETNVIWVNFSATQIVTIASWTSTAAPVLVGFLLSLLGYPIAKSFLENSRKQNARNLPTPLQLNLLITVVGSANVNALWQWFQYRCWNMSNVSHEHRKQKHGQAGILGIALMGLSVASLLGSVHLFLFLSWHSHVSFALGYVLEGFRDKVPTQYNY
jgi:hypothetical protein